MLLYLRSATPGKPLPSVNLPQAFWPNFCRRFEKTPADFLLCIFRITYKYEQIMPKTSDGFKLFCQNDLQKFATSAGKNLPASIPLLHASQYEHLRTAGKKYCPVKILLYLSVSHDPVQQV